MFRLSIGWCLLMLYLILIIYVTSIFIFYCGKLVINLHFIRNKNLSIKFVKKFKVKKRKNKELKTKRSSY